MVSKREEILQDIVKQVRNQEFPYKKRVEQPRDWNAYDIAQCREVSEMLMLIRSAVNEADSRLEKKVPEKYIGPGRPQIKAANITKVLLMQSTSV